MSLFSVPEHISLLLHRDLDGPHADRIEAASFADGEEDEIQIHFFRLWGRVIRREYSRHSTVTTYAYVEGDDLNIFNHLYYREGAPAAPTAENGR
jgi:hypothetical protein